VNRSLENESVYNNEAHAPMRFHARPRVPAVASGSSAYSRSCETTGFSGFDSLVATSPNGYQSLVPSFYDALTTCIGKLEGASQ